MTSMTVEARVHGVQSGQWYVRSGRVL